MTTKPHSSVKSAPDKALEKAAYASVAEIPMIDPHDRDRLGYNVWLWLSTGRDSLEHVVHSAASRLQIGEAEAVSKIRESLKQHGVTPQG